MMRLAHRIYVAGLSPPAEDHVRMVLAMEARSVRTVKCPLCHLSQVCLIVLMV